jgi:hypothetical protein
MERKATPEIAREILGKNFIGLNELKKISESMPVCTDVIEPPVIFAIDFLEQHKETHLLILGLSWLANGKALTIRSLREHFGFDPAVFEPCFYNQDWYLNEKFIDYKLPNEWFLVGKNIAKESKGVSPEIVSQKFRLPSALLCTYTFFVSWFYHSKILWTSDYIWCDDLDSNGDRIYVGRYSDPKKINKNGFSIHRHLRISDSYGCLELF